VAEKEKDAAKERERAAERLAEKTRRKHDVKELRFSARTADNDMQMKLSKAREMLSDGNNVKLTVKFKKGERLGKRRNEFGKELLERIEHQLSTNSKRVRDPVMQGPVFMSMQLAPQ
jgi:translation initiation factor IF-3